MIAKGMTSTGWQEHQKVRRESRAVWLHCEVCGKRVRRADQLSVGGAKAWHGKCLPQNKS